MLVRTLLCAKIEGQNGGEQRIFQWQNERIKCLFFSKLLFFYATANKWKSDQEGIFFRFMLSESSLQVGSNELDGNEFTAHGLVGFRKILWLISMN